MDPNYLDLKCVKRTILQIENPPSREESNPLHHFEHYVGSFAFTIIKHVFADVEWIITGEKTDSASNKRPDITIERVTEKDELELHMVYELKRTGGDPFYKALNQAIDSIVESIESKGHTTKHYEIFIVIQRGLDIGFFEYHSYKSMMDEEEIPNFFGCTSLTQEYENEQHIQGPVVPSDNKMKNILFTTSTSLSKDDFTKLEARNYLTPCVLNLTVEEHRKKINALFYHIANKQPRSLED